MPHFDFVIVNWNSKFHLKKCLESIMRNPEFIDHVGKVIIVDNGSTDNSIDFIRDIGSNRFTLIKSDKNLGFGAACNYGFSFSASSHVIFMNPDAWLDRRTLSCLREKIEHASDEVGVFGVRLLNSDNSDSESYFDLPTVSSVFKALFGLEKIFPHTSKKNISGRSDGDFLVEQVIGAFFVVPRDDFVSMGMFDERFFVYYEEVDYCKRVLSKNKKIMYIATCVAHHYGGGCTENFSSTRLYLSLYSRLKYFNKHHRDSYVIVFFMTFFLEPLTRIIYCFARRNLTCVRDTFKAFGILVKKVYYDAR